MSLVPGGLELEWLEADGRGGFAMGTAAGVRTRRYHALLVAARSPPTDRFVLVSGVEVELMTPVGAYALSSHEYEPGVFHPNGWTRLRDFRAQPWPRWVFVTEDGSVVEQELMVLRETGETLLAFRLLRGSRGSRLTLRPLFAARHQHAIARENAGFRFEPERHPDGLRFMPYPDVPAVTLRTTGRWRQAPLWFRQFRYREELARGLDHVEDLASPGVVELDLGREAALVAFGSTPSDVAAPSVDLAAAATRERERRSRARSLLELSADAYVVERGSGLSLVAGYPWFTDWGRDTFIALRGLCLALGRLEVAERILLEWSRHVSGGLLPNAFPDARSEPDDNSVDAPLWFVVAVHAYLQALGEHRREVEPSTEKALHDAVGAVLTGLIAGTRHGIRVDADGLLAAGVPGRQLTWMDAKIGDHVVTPRIGKPVEIQALWLNALRIGAERMRGFHDLYERALASFRTRFAAGEAGLFDVVDDGHVKGRVDAAFRPNQILAVGGLPYAVLDGRLARKLVERVELELVTPLGLRTLAPWEQAYVGRYTGGPAERDRAYHQGTVWPWLLGPFVEAWLRVQGDGPSTRRIARERFLLPWLAHLSSAGLGHVSEIADGDFPHVPRGAPFQAWSLGELIRVSSLLESDRPLR